MIIINYNDIERRFNPATPVQALLLAEACIRAQGYPHLSPVALINSMRKGEVTADFFSGKGMAGSRLTLKDLLPGIYLRTGVSEIEIVRVRPTEREITYKVQDKYVRMDATKFLNLANQQGYRKIWDVRTFLITLKSALKPYLAAVPLMWVLKIVIDSIRKRNVTKTIPQIIMRTDPLLSAK